MIPYTRNIVSGRRLHDLRQQLTANEADMAKVQRKIICLNIQFKILAIEIKICDCKTTARAVLCRVINAVRQGSLCDTQAQRAQSPTEKVALLYEQNRLFKRYVTQEDRDFDTKRSKLAQLARKQDHYTAILIRMEEKSKNAGIEIARCRVAGGHPDAMPSITDRAGSALLQSSIRNCMSPSEILTLYHNEVERSRGLGGCWYRGCACRANCGECRKYEMERCWWCP